MDSDTTKVIHQMRQELVVKLAENQKLTDQLNCLVSLIKRSWSGDKHATLHLSNIVGMEPPQRLTVKDKIIARPNSQFSPDVLTKQTKCEQNWERLTLKLLDHHYQSLQQEIREYQQHYIENRQAYMDAVLQDHQETMSRIPFHRKADAAQTLEEMDSKFIRHSKPLQRMQAGSKGPYRLVQSAGYQRKAPVGEVVEKMEVSLFDLMGEGYSSGSFSHDQQTTNEPQILKSPMNANGRPLSSTLPKHPPNVYNDPGRYTHGNLFALRESDGVKKPRPVSASSLRAGDIIRSRPRSGRNIITNNRTEVAEKHVFVTQKSERPLKYEATYPVNSRPKSAKHRSSSTGSTTRREGRRAKISTPLTDVINASSKTITSTADIDDGTDSILINKHGHQDEEPTSYHDGKLMNHNEEPALHHDDNNEEIIHSGAGLSAKPPAGSRAKSAFKRRPAFIDEFTKDEQAVRNIEEDFRKTALGLQKKLGIGDSGIISID